MSCQRNFSDVVAWICIFHTCFSCQQGHQNRVVALVPLQFSQDWVSHLWRTKSSLWTWYIVLQGTGRSAYSNCSAARTRNGCDAESRHCSALHTLTLRRACARQKEETPRLIHCHSKDVHLLLLIRFISAQRGACSIGRNTTSLHQSRHSPQPAAAHRRNVESKEGTSQPVKRNTQNEYQLRNSA